VQLLVPDAEDLQAAARAAAGPRAVVLAPPHVSLGWPWRLAPPTAEVAGSGPVVLPLLHPRIHPARRDQVLVDVPVGDPGHAAVRSLAQRLGWSGPPPTAHLSLVRVRDAATAAAVAAAVRPLLPRSVVAGVVQVTARTAGRWTEVGRAAL
jgi:hypothetical protein